jgi:Lon protease-like protein
LFTETLLESNNSSMQQELLPLFPLQVVLFPRTPVALHIFEERYKEMIGAAIDSNSEFGVVLASEKGIVSTGCTAVVDRVVQRYPDGRLDIIAAGRRRFEIQDLNDERAYLRGAVDFFDDEENDPPLPEPVKAHVLDLYSQVLETSPQSPLLEPELTEGQLSFQLAQVIPDLNLRQLLLISRSETERMQQIAAYLPALLKKRRESAQAQRIASTNGHGKKPAGL